jgi:hypothetical protein
MCHHILKNIYTYKKACTIGLKPMMIAVAVVVVYIKTIKAERCKR